MCFMVDDIGLNLGTEELQLRVSVKEKKNDHDEVARGCGEG